MTEDAVTELQTRVAALADDVQYVAAAIWKQVQSGLTDVDTALDAIIALINHARAVVTGWADVAVAAQIEALTATPTLPSAVAPVDDTERLVKAVRTITADTDADTAMQVSRLARAESLSAAQDATATAMEHHDAVIGWVRQLNPEACELCQWWARGGRIWKPDHKFARHPGCNCQMQVVTEENDDPRRRRPNPRRRTRSGQPTRRVSRSDRR